MKKLFLLALSLLVFSCTAPAIDESVCLSGDCAAEFWVDTVGHPGTYKDGQGVWHIKHAGLNYFTIKGGVSQLSSKYVVNNVPLIITAFDSNMFYVPGSVTWNYPVYSYQGLWSSNQMNTPIAVGTKSYTFPQLANQTSIMNLVGYTIQPHTDMYANPSVLRSYFATYSKYTYEPQQSMVFFKDFVGKSATIYIEVLYGEDKITVKKELKVVFEL